MINWRFFILKSRIISLVLLSSNLFAQNKSTIDIINKKFKDSFKYYEDTTAKLEFNDILERHQSFTSVRRYKKVNSMNWLFFSIRQSVDNTDFLYVDFGEKKKLDKIDCYCFSNNKLIIKKTGRVIIRAIRDVPSRIYNVIKFKFTPEVEQYDCYVKVESYNFSDIILLDEKKWLNKQSIFWKNSLLYMCLFGALGMMFLYNFTIYLLGNDKTYLYYSLYVFTISTFIFIENNLFQEIILYNISDQMFLPVIFGQLAILFYIRFILNFIPEYLIHKKWRKYFSILGYYIIFTIIICELIFFFNNDISLMMLTGNMLSLLTFIVLLLFLLQIAFQAFSNPLVRYLTIGTFQLIVLMLGSLVIQIFFEVSILAEVVSVSVLIEIVLFSLGLGHRVRVLEEENNLLLSKQKKLLQEKVNEKSQDLILKNNELTILIEELTQAQEEILSQRDYLNLQNQSLKTKGKLIEDSIKAAKAIQNASLPSLTKFNNLFDDFFILNKPRDIVSGDFYWLEEKDNKIILAIADCTGHGVPGAFMTLIGINLLNKIVNVLGITNPAMILQKLDVDIRKSLHQEVTKNHDGMDLVIIEVEKIDKRVRLTFSGARNNIYIWNNSKLSLLKGTRKSVGGTHSNTNKFTNQTLDLSNNIVLYAFTDGLKDQNNSSRDKFGSEKLHNLIKYIVDKPIKYQKTIIEKNLEAFMKEEPQRDDILFLGLNLNID